MIHLEAYTNDNETFNTLVNILDDMVEYDNISRHDAERILSLAQEMINI